MIGNEFASVLDRARTGDESAFACLRHDIDPTLTRYLLVIAGEVDQDVVAHTWTIVGRGLARFCGDEMAWRTWVFATARRAGSAAGGPAAGAHRLVLTRGLTDPGRLPDPALVRFIGAAGLL